MERTPVLLTTVLCLFILSTTAFTGDNLLRNTSFESQGSGPYTAEHWEWEQPDYYGSTWGNVARENWRAHSGSYIATLHAAWNAGDLNYGGWWQRADSGIVAGDTVEACGWFWADSNWTASAQSMKLEFYNSEGTLISEVSTNLDDVAALTHGAGNTNFIQKTIQGKAPEGTAWGQFVVYVEGAGGSGALQFDDVSVSTLAGRIQNFDGWGSASTDGCHEFDDWVLCEGKAVSNANRYVIFSKYVQGTSVDNALELYNDTDFDIDLGAESFVIQIYTNGYSTNPRSIALSGTLSAKGTLVIANSESWGASTNLTEYADIENGSMRYMDGNDAVVLRKGGASGTVIDSIGQVGNNPGSGGWGVSTNSTLKHTLVRKTSVTSGRTDAWSAFTPIYEWDAYPDHTYSNLGSYVVSSEGYRPTDISVSIAAGLTNYLSTPYFEDGLGSFNFWYARDGSGEALSYDIQVSADNTNWITVDSMTNIVSTNYLFHSFFYYSETNYYYRLNHVGGNGRLWVDYVEIKEPTAIQRDQYFDDWPDSATNYDCHSHMDWVLCTGKITTVDAYSGSAAQTAPSPGNQIRSPLFTNGCGEVTFVYRRASGGSDPISFALQTSSNGTDWITQTTVSNITATSYQDFYHYLYITDPVYVRIYHQTGASSLLADDISIGYPTIYRGQNFNQWPTEKSYGTYHFQGWTVSNGLLYPSIKNYDGLSARLKDTEYLYASIQSPYLPGGVGSIEFKYAWWGTGSKPDYSIQTSTDGVSWVTIETIEPMTNDYNNYQTYYKFLYDPTSHYVRIYHEAHAGAALFDDIYIDTPKPGASVMMDGWHVPETVRETNSVTLAADIIPRYGATITNVMAYFRIGSSGAFSNLMLIETNLYSYTTTSSIPPLAAGTRVEYYFECYFSGPGADLNSPSYFPSGGSSAPTNYIVASSTYDNNFIWINEMNAQTSHFDEGPPMVWQNDTNEFIEIVVYDTNNNASILVGCQLVLVNVSEEQYATYTITNTITYNNGFGFFTLGDPQISPPVDMVFTNLASELLFDNLADGYPDGILFLDPQGTPIQTLCYGGTIVGYERIPIIKDYVTDLSEWSFSFAGTGTTKSAFSWSMTNMTPGAVNIGQELVSDNPPPEFYVISAHMTTNVVIEHTWESGWNYTPWYATNLPTGEQNWLQVTPFYEDQDGSTNTIWFDFPTGDDCQYFRVRATD